ncbi:MAG: glucosaminidase domain-containing protein, partial [Candidatus Omnitrophota bacterium]
RDVFKGTSLTGSMLASAAKKTYETTGMFVPLELALSQAQFETSMGRKGRNPATNPFNVGEYDEGTKIKFKNIREGINSYYKLMANDYLKTKPIDKLLTDFTNFRGNRYASDPLYEQKISGQMNFIRNFFQKGE